MKIRRKQRITKVHGILWGLFAIFMSFCFICAIMACVVFAKGDEWLEDLPSIDEDTIMNTDKASTIYASDGTTVLAEFQLQNRQPVESLDQISPYVVQGTLATEDTRFYDHNGVDLQGIIRATVVNLLGGELEGASTITQQLVRNTLISDEASDISVKRKIREIKLALEVEEYYSKDQILLMYLNTINYGDGAYGIQAAAQHYFSKNASELTIAESATLIGIPQSPTYLNPTEYPAACKERRNIVLARMLAAGVITAEEYSAAISSDIELNVAEKEGINGIYLYPYFTSYVRDTLLETYSSADLYEGGWKIYTTLDLATQHSAELAAEAQYGRMQEDFEVALVSIVPTTGAVTAMIGGKDFKTNQFNIATQKGRPTGSAFKAFTLVTAIEQGINPSTLIDCTNPLIIQTDTGQAVINNFGKTDYGICSIEIATALSSNTGFVRLQQQVGTQNVISTAHRMGVTQQNLPEVPTLTLGVADVTPLDMASAYSTLAAQGVHHDPYVIQRIEGNAGETIYIHNDEDPGTRVLTESVAGAATEVLSGVFNYVFGTAHAALLADGRDVAGKSGTSEDYHDNWLVGYTPDLVCAIWIGDRSNQLAADKTSGNYIFKDFMDMALANVEPTSFPAYTPPVYNNPWNEEQNKKLNNNPQNAPSTVGMQVAQAQETLKDYNVSVVYETSATVAKDVVISQSVSGSTIVLTVSRGAS